MRWCQVDGVRARAWCYRRVQANRRCMLVRWLQSKCWSFQTVFANVALHSLSLCDTSGEKNFVISRMRPVTHCRASGHSLVSISCCIFSESVPGKKTFVNELCGAKKKKSA